MAAKIKVLVKPNSKSNSFGISDGNVLWIRVKAPAQDGKANKAALEYLAEVLGCKPNEICLQTGHASWIKIFSVPSLPEGFRNLEKSDT